HSWNSTIWNTSSNGNNSRVNWANGDQARFNAGANSYTLNVSSAGTTLSGIIVNNGNVTVGTTGTGTLALSSNATFNVTTSLTLTAALGQSGGTRSLTKSGAGTLTLSGNNTYAGGTTLSAGT